MRHLLRFPRTAQTVRQKIQDRQEEEKEGKHFESKTVLHGDVVVLALKSSAARRLVQLCKQKNPHRRVKGPGAVAATSDAGRQPNRYQQLAGRP